MRGAEEEEQRGAKKEERMSSGSNTCGSPAASTTAVSGSSGTCASMGASSCTAPLRADIVVRASSRVAGVRPGIPVAPSLAAAPLHEWAAGSVSSLWPRARSASRRWCRVFQQVLAVGASGLEKALSWVKHVHDMRLCGVEIGDMSAEEE